MATNIQNSVYPWDRCNDLLNSWSDRFSEKAVLPVIKESYLLTGNAISLCAGHFSTRLKNGVANSWTDPVSSRKVLWVTKPIEHIALWIAKCKATERWPLHYWNVSLISSAQHLYLYIKSANYFLTLPGILKEYTATLSFDRFINKLSVFFGKSFVIISELILVAKYVALKIIDLAIKITDLVINCFTFSNQVQILEYLKEVIKDATDKLHLKFVDTASIAIDKTEDKFRKKIVLELANYITAYVVKTFNRAALKSALGLGVYLGAQYALASSLSSKTIRMTSLVAVGALLWKGVLESTFDAYYGTYIREFDPNAPSLNQFLKRYSLHYFYPPLLAIQKYTSAP